jgi:hypothetical protein
VDANNIPLMNLLYKNLGLYHKIILEEDDTATDVDSSDKSSEDVDDNSDALSAVATYKSIIEISQEKSVALGDEVHAAIDPFLLSTSGDVSTKEKDAVVTLRSFFSDVSMDDSNSGHIMDRAVNPLKIRNPAVTDSKIESLVINTISGALRSSVIDPGKGRKGQSKLLGKAMKEINDYVVDDNDPDIVGQTSDMFLDNPGLED